MSRATKTASDTCRSATARKTTSATEKSLECHQRRKHQRSVTPLKRTAERIEAAKVVPSLQRCDLRYICLAAVTLQNTALALSMAYSRRPSKDPEQPSSQLYLVTTAVFCGEVLKLLVSGVLAFLNEPASEVFSSLIRGRNVLAMLVPAALYTLQNNLQYVAVSNLDISVCQVLYQLKLVTTALFSVLLLDRQLLYFQWLGILFCALGVGVVQVSTVGSSSNTAPENPERGGMQATLGLFAVVLSCTTSGLAAVVSEKVFKSGSTSIWVRNIHLSMWSLLAGVSAMYFSPDGQVIQEKGFFVGYNSLVCIVIGLQALGGMVVALVSKYADNVAKGFATSISIILTCGFSVLLFDLELNALFASGTLLVLSSLMFYSRPPKEADDQFRVLVKLSQSAQVQQPA